MESSKKIAEQLSGSTQPGVPASKKEKTIRCSSELSSEKFSYTWKLIDFDEIPFVSGYPVYSPPFYINKKTSSLWQIVMTKHTYHSDKGETSDNEEGDISGSEDEDEPCEKVARKEIVHHEKIKRLGLRLLKSVENDADVWEVVRYSFIVKTSGGTVVTTKEREEPGHAGFRGIPVYAFLTEKDFGEGKFFNEKHVEVTCDINYSYVDGSALENPVAYEGKQPVPDLRVLYITSKFHDIVIEADEEEHRVHKVVLQAAIPGFEKILKETDKPKTKFDLRLDAEVGKAMIDFMYSGKIVDGFPIGKCLALYEAAKRYGVDCLDQYCSKYFKSNLPSDVCRKCLCIDEGLEDCLEIVKKLGVDKVKGILSKAACVHKNVEKQQ